jgi:dienelactone hydrolase
MAELGYDSLVDFTTGSFTFQNKTRPLYRKGQGPGVVIIHEIPGITPPVADFARRVAASGFTSVMPVLFGTPGKPMTATYALGQMVRACISSEFYCFATKRSSPITEWLRALCRQVHTECGGPGVGAVGMCLTGGFALALMVDESVMAPVLSQPSIPFPLGQSRKEALGISDPELAVVKERAAAGCTVLGLRFTADPMVPGDRFTTLRRELGDGFIAVEIDSSPGNPYGIPRIAHSVLTTHFTDREGHPTRDALEQVITHFRERLQV